MRLSISAVLAAVAVAHADCGEGLIYDKHYVYQYSTFCPKTQNVFNCEHETRLSFDTAGKFLFEAPKVDYLVAVICPNQNLYQLFHCMAGELFVFDNPCGQTADGVKVWTQRESIP
ncbi:hypothetical protein E4U42_002557 [Claviceps africana]|uniref:Uncharacterized protein n=1 Tax=Claviceps africana TaxID=83212 RepID=A0A8K0NM74_9HYPO|nr:hypothetical protein E4U42_002557 [Claviceps africana]